MTYLMNTAFQSSGEHTIFTNNNVEDSGLYFFILAGGKVSGVRVLLGYVVVIPTWRRCCIKIIKIYLF